MEEDFDDDGLGPSRRQLLKEMNQYSKDAHLGITFTPEDIRNKFSEYDAKKLLKDKTFEKMYADYIIRKIKDRKGKSNKSKSKRKIIKKSKGCGCK